MEISDISELQYITHISNLKSILEHGILCHREARKHDHESVADEEVQGKRAKKIVPGGLPLHQYANLYINARNPMLYRNCQEYSSQKICVLRIGRNVLFLPNVVISDGNAASNYTAFGSVPDGFRKMDKALVFAKYWKDDDLIIQYKKTRAICAEVLVPQRIDASYITGVYCVAGLEALLKVKDLQIPIKVNQDLFFET